jgi:hypothetical protein
MYEMETGAKQGRLTPDQAKNALGTSTVAGFKFTDIEITGEEALITVEVTYRLSGLKSPFDMTRRDPWTLLNGTWYHGRAWAPAKPKRNPDGAP